MATEYLNVPGFGSVVIEDTDTWEYVNVPGFGALKNPNAAAAGGGGRIMSSLAGFGGLAGKGGIAGAGGGLAG